MNKIEKEARYQKAVFIAADILSNLPYEKWGAEKNDNPNDDLMDWLLWILEDDFPYKKDALERRLVKWSNQYHHHDHLVYTDL